jgi:hypothetical protein
MSSTMKRLAALLGAGVLSLAMFGTALAATPASDQGVVPVEHAGNITLAGEGGSTGADCAAADGIETGNTGGSEETESGVTVTWTYDSDTKEFGFTATGGLVTIAYIKGSNSYNEYDYTGFTDGGVDSDGGMFAPDNGSEGPAGLSHAVFCTTPGEEEEPTPTPEFTDEGEGDTDAPSEPNTATIGGNGTSGPADGAWLLVVALGVLLASVVVMTPARAKSQR